MKTRQFLAAAIVALTAIGAVAAPSFEYVDWFTGPIQFVMSKEEIAAWRTVQTDDEAKAFVALFWARRDPTPDTARNEGRELFESRVQWADKNLRDGSRVRGAMTDRGKAYILYGPPKRIERASAERQPNADLMGLLQKDERYSDNWVQWIYEGEDARALFLVPKATIRFVDRMGTEEFKVERGMVDLVAAQARAVARTILSPELTVAPVHAEPAATAAPAAAAAAAPVTVTALSTPALAAAVTDFKNAATNPYANKAFASWGEYVTSYGEYYVPVMLAVPKAGELSAGSDVTFFGVI
jgi:GWxTD domain-containing protein